MKKKDGVTDQQESIGVNDPFWKAWFSSSGKRDCQTEIKKGIKKGAAKVRWPNFHGQ